jgi:phage shock protein A
MGYVLRMSAEIHDWLTNLRGEDPAAAAVVGDALAALIREGAALGPPLVVPVSRRRPDPADALDQAYQDSLVWTQIVRRRVADAATLARDILSQVTELESLRDQLSVQRQRALDEDMPDAAAMTMERLTAAEDLAAKLRRRLPGIIEAERQLTDRSRAVHAQTDAFRTRKEVLKATYSVAQAECWLEENLASLDAETAGRQPLASQDDTPPSEAAARLSDITDQIERELRRQERADGLLELRPGARGATGTGPRSPSETGASDDGESDASDDGEIRMLFAVEPPGTALLIAVLEDRAAVDDHYREAVFLSAGVLHQARAAQAPEAAAHGYDDVASLASELFAPGGSAPTGP